MQTEIRHNPAFALARITLGGGEEVRVQGGAMAAHSAGVELEAKMEGGLMKSLKRSMLGGEAFFMSTYTAPSQGGWVEVAATLPGDAFTVEVMGEYFLTRGAYLASAMGLTIDTKWGGFGDQNQDKPSSGNVRLMDTFASQAANPYWRAEAIRASVIPNYFSSGVGLGSFACDWDPAYKMDPRCLQR